MDQHMIDLTDSNEERVQRLVNAGIFPRTMEQQIMFIDDRIVYNKRFGALDSFEGGLVHGFSGPNGIFISHLFDDGYHIGQPTAEYWEIGLHETLHQVLDRLGDIFSKWRLSVLEEVLVSHFTAISREGSTLPKGSIVGAAHEGSYPHQRRLFGLALEQPDNLQIETAGQAFAGWRLAFADLVTRLETGFARLFPEHENAFQTFLSEYGTMRPLDLHACAQRWADEAARRVLGA
jgi:hypothetical protein